MDKIYNYELIFESRNELNDLKKECRKVGKNHYKW